jgi:hypothetical protein
MSSPLNDWKKSSKLLSTLFFVCLIAGLCHSTPSKSEILEFFEFLKKLRTKSLSIPPSPEKRGEILLFNIEKMELDFFAIDEFFVLLARKDRDRSLEEEEDEEEEEEEKEEEDLRRTFRTSFVCSFSFRLSSVIVGSI